MNLKSISTLSAFGGFLAATLLPVAAMAQQVELTASAEGSATNITTPSEQDDGTNESLSSFVNLTVEGWKDSEGVEHDGVKDLAEADACTKAKVKLGATHACPNGRTVPITVAPKCTFPEAGKAGAVACTANMNGKAKDYNGEADTDNIKGDTKLEEKISEDDVREMCEKDKENMQANFGDAVCENDPKVVAGALADAYPDETYLFAECKVTATAHGTADCPAQTQFMPLS